MSQISTLFVVKDAEEYCFLFDERDPATLFEVLFDKTETPGGGLDRDDVFEVIEGMVPSRLRAI